MQGEGGLMSITGAADGPPFRLGVAIADIVSGMFAAYGVATALFARERTGRGQMVDLAMLDSVVALLTYQAGNYFASGRVPTRLGNRHPASCRMRRLPRPTAISSSRSATTTWRRFCGVAGLEPDERFRDEPPESHGIRRVPPDGRGQTADPDAGTLD
jgi:crotonobetainyl-CoA:carnitine CoA-transferase CaiB-like acyl-CoA transferase